MSDGCESVRALAPTAEEIVRRFRHPVVASLRPCIIAGVDVLGVVLRFRFTAFGAEKLTQVQEPFIIAANHMSHADTAAILGTLPGNLRSRTCVAAALDVFGSVNGEKRTMRGLRRECLQVAVAAGFHAFAFDRLGSPLRSVRTAFDLVRGGWNLLLFPEGTRSRTGDIAPFKAGVGVIAKLTGRPVVPVHVSGGIAILPCGAFLPRSGTIVVNYGDPLRCGASERTPDFVERLQEAVLDLGSAELATGAAAALAAKGLY